MGSGRNLYLLAPSPFAELEKALPRAQIEFDPGMSPAEAALTARRADVAVVLAIRVDGEGFDDPDLSLPWGQDAVIEAVAAANPNTIVVLETGNPVTMPWHESVRAIVEAWYPGQAGGQAIAEILTGAVNPSGRLPVTFPAHLDQTPRPELPGLGTPWGTPTTVHYDEGAEIGYRWFAKTGATPLYPFGHGLSYTSFVYSDLRAEGGDAVSVTFTVTNTGERAGADVPQLYLTDPPGDRRMRLLGFERVELAAGEAREVSMTADPRLLARFDHDADRWEIAEGAHRIVVGSSAAAPLLETTVDLPNRTFDP
jgi:beta-glucosidase